MAEKTKKTPYNDEGLGRLYKDKTAIMKHREWRGLQDTLVDYGYWLQLWGILLKWVLRHPITNVKAIFRYRWMLNYLTVPSFFDRQTSRMKGVALKAAHRNLNTIARGATQELTKTFKADEHLHPGTEESKKIICCDELIPAIVFEGFKEHKPVAAQAMPGYLPSLVNQHSPVHYIEASEGYGLPADVCSLPSLEAGIAIEDDYPKLGCCFVSTNMPCDGSIMTNTIQDRRYDLPTHVLNIPLRWKREDVQEYAVEEYRTAIEFMEKETGEEYDWERLRAACERQNEISRLKMERWEMNMTDTPPLTGSSNWLYRIFSYNLMPGKPLILENDRKVTEMFRRELGKRRYPAATRHRAVSWNTVANMYPNFDNWLLDCWGIEVVCNMIDYQGTNIIDTSTRESMLEGIAKVGQGATMRVHTKGGYKVMLDDLWVKVEEYRADLVVMYDQISWKGVAAIKGLFEEQARARGINMVWVEHDLMDPTGVSRRAMRDQISKYMETVMGEEPLDPTLVDFDDSECW